MARGGRGGGAKGDEELYTVQNAFWGSRVEMQCKKDKCHVMSCPTSQ